MLKKKDEKLNVGKHRQGVSEYESNITDKELVLKGKIVNYILCAGTTYL